jgi:hypothetical protein
LRDSRNRRLRRPWFSLEPVDEPFFAAAPVQLREDFAIPKPAETVWTELISDDALGWCRLVREIQWTSPRPFGVGATRTARLLGGASVLREFFFIWDEGRRQSFYGLEASHPMFRRVAEDYVVEPTSQSSCRLAWIIAIEPRPLFRPLNPLNRLLLRTLFRDTRKHYGAEGHKT